MPGEVCVPNWTILLIIGSSATGKTTLAGALRPHYGGVSVLHMDDMRLAIEQITIPAQHPSIHRFLSDPTIWRDAGAVRDALIATAETLEPAIAIVIANHLDQPEMGPLIIEGDSVLPRAANPAYAASLPQLAARALTEKVRALCVYEAEEAVLLPQCKHAKEDLPNIQSRSNAGRRGGNGSTANISAQKRRSMRYLFSPRAPTTPHSLVRCTFSTPESTMRLAILRGSYLGANCFGQVFQCRPVVVHEAAPAVYASVTANGDVYLAGANRASSTATAHRRCSTMDFVRIRHGKRGQCVRLRVRWWEYRRHGATPSNRWSFPRSGDHLCSSSSPARAFRRGVRVATCAARQAPNTANIERHH